MFVIGFHLFIHVITFHGFRFFYHHSCLLSWNSDRFASEKIRRGSHTTDSNPCIRFPPKQPLCCRSCACSNTRETAASMRLGRTGTAWPCRETYTSWWFCNALRRSEAHGRFRCRTCSGIGCRTPSSIPAARQMNSCSFRLNL